MTWLVCDFTLKFLNHFRKVSQLSESPFLASQLRTILKGELKHENKLISYERAFKLLENDMYIAGIDQAVPVLLSFIVRSGNHQMGISLLQKFLEIFRNMRLVSLKMTSHLTIHNFQIFKIEKCCKPCKI